MCVAYTDNMTNANNDTLRKQIRAEALRLNPALDGMSWEELGREMNRALHQRGDEVVACAACAMRCLNTDDGGVEDLGGARSEIIGALVGEVMRASLTRRGTPQSRAEARAWRAEIAARFAEVAS